MNLKKITSGALALAMVASLAACGNANTPAESKPAETPTTTTPSTTTPAETTAATTKAPETTKAAETTAAATAAATTAAAEEKGGCGSTIGIASLAVLAVAGGVTFVATKKKED